MPIKAVGLYPFSRDTRMVSSMNLSKPTLAPLGILFTEEADSVLTVGGLARLADLPAIPSHFSEPLGALHCNISAFACRQTSRPPWRRNGARDLDRRRITRSFVKPFPSGSLVPLWTFVAQPLRRSRGGSRQPILVCVPAQLPIFPNSNRGRLAPNWLCEELVQFQCRGFWCS